jgi:hypothetical protein
LIAVPVDELGALSLPEHALLTWAVVGEDRLFVPVRVPGAGTTDVVGEIFVVGGMRDGALRGRVSDVTVAGEVAIVSLGDQGVQAVPLGR